MSHLFMSYNKVQIMHKVLKKFYLHGCFLNYAYFISQGS